MKVPLEISFRDLQKTDALEQLIRDKVEKLERFCDHIASCRVAVEKPQKHQRIGNPYRVRIDLKVPPGHEVVVRREPSEGDLHQGLPAVIRDAFAAAQRQLRDLTMRQRGEVKNHAVLEEPGVT